MEVFITINDKGEVVIMSPEEHRRSEEELKQKVEALGAKWDDVEEEIRRLSESREIGTRERLKTPQEFLRMFQAQELDTSGRILIPPALRRSAEPDE